MERWSGKVALVTGASVGIGAAIVEKLVGHGVKVIGCGRNLEKLEEFARTLEKDADKKIKAPGCFKPLKCDVSKEEEILAMFDFVKKEFGGLHICVNNAGLGFPTPLLTGKTEDFRLMTEVNVIGLLVVTRESVKVMKECSIDDGHIINISSMGGHRVQPGPYAFYQSTKYAVTALTIGIRNELRAMGSHIRVTQISPGLVETEFVERGSSAEIAANLYGSMKCLEASDVADSIIYALSAPAHCGIHDILMLPVEQDYSGGLFKK